MANTVYFAGSEPDCVSGGFTLSTTGVDTNYVRTGMRVDDNLDSVIITLAEEIGANSADGFWIHYRKYQDNANESDLANPVLIYDQSNNLIAGLLGTLGWGNVKARVYANDLTYSETSNFAGVYGNDVVDGITVTVDIHVYTNENAYAQLDVFVNGNQVATVTDTSGYNCGMKKAVFARPIANTGYYCIYSEFIVANFDTRGLRVGTYIPTGDGTYTDGAGTYANIDETNPDTAVIALAEVGDKQSYTLAKYGSPSLPSILAVAVNGLVSSDGTNDMQAGLRIDGVDYFSADLGLGASFTPTSVVWNRHPGNNGWLPQNPASDIEVIYKVVA